MLQTVEFLTNGAFGSFTYVAGEIYEYVKVKRCCDKCCYIFKIGSEIIQFPRKWYGEVFQFLNAGVKKNGN